MSTTPARFVCPNCGGTNMQVEALAWWNEKKQDWDYEISDSGEDFCIDCMNQVYGEFVPITDLKTAAQVAINQNGGE